MRCAHCGYHSFDDLECCKKCGEPLHRLRAPLALPRKDNCDHQQPHSNNPPLSLRPKGRPVQVAQQIHKSFPPFLLELNRNTSFFEKQLLETDGDAEKVLEDGVIIASLVRRIAATVVDFVVLLAIITAFIGAGAWGFNQPYPVFITQIMTQLPLSICYYLVAILTALSYFTLLHNCCGQTLGKMLLRLQVVSVDGSVPTLAEALLRSTGGLMGVLAGGLGYLWILFDPQRRGWNDRLAGTQVVGVSAITAGADVRQGDEEVGA